MVSSIVRSSSSSLSKVPNTAQPQIDESAEREKFSDYFYLQVPFEEKEKAKELGAKWDKENKKWYVSKNADLTPFKRWTKVFLNVPFEDKDAVKSHGAMWDREVSKWFITGAIDQGPFAKYLENSNKSQSPSPKATNLSNSKSPKGTIAIIDIDTTGLPKKVAGDKYDHFTNIASYNPSRIVQLTYALCSLSNFKVVNTENYILTPDGFSITNSEFHGITNEKAEKEGVAPAPALREFMKNILTADLIIAHNYEFCSSILKSELYRYGIFEELDRFSSSKSFCLMEQSKNLTGLTNVAGKLKSPSLKELVKIRLNSEFPTVHDSSMDVDFIRRILQTYSGKELNLSKMISNEP